MDTVHHGYGYEYYEQDDLGVVLDWHNTNPVLCQGFHLVDNDVLHDEENVPHHNIHSCWKSTHHEILLFVHTDLDPHTEVDTKEDRAPHHIHVELEVQVDKEVDKEVDTLHSNFHQRDAKRKKKDTNLLLAGRHSWMA